MKAVKQKSQLLIIFILTLFVITGHPSPAQAVQPLAALTAEVYIENVQIVSNQFSWEIHFRPTAGWTGGPLNANEYLNEASWYFTYNHLALGAPVLTYQNTLVASHYVNIVGTISTPVRRVYVSTGDMGDPQHVVEGTKYHLYTVSMTILDFDAMSGLDWDTANSAVENYAGAVAFGPAVTFTGSGDTPLPVQLSSFTGTAQEGAIKLEWSTQSEINNLGFNIYRASRQDQKFQKINGSMIAGAGTSSEKKLYVFTDIHISKAGTYFYKLEQRDIDGQSEWHGPIQIQMDESMVIPNRFSLSQNYPNPFNPTTTIHYGLAEETSVRLQIFNMRGELVCTLVDVRQPAGYYEHVWNATSDAGMRLPSGIYFYKLQTAMFTEIKKMILTK